MTDKSLHHMVKQFGQELVRRVNNRESFDRLETDMVARLAVIPRCGLVISGYHRRGRSSRNLFIHSYPGAPYVAVINLVDGEENYFRGCSIYGVSLSMTCRETGEHVAVVYDGLTRQVTELSGAGLSEQMIRLPASEGQHGSDTIAERPSRLVVALGRVFPVGKAGLAELKNVSVRSLGSTTVSILEILRGHVDVYMNTTKIWNIWWAIWLPESVGLCFEDIATGQSIRDRIDEILATPSETIPLICYRERKVKDRLPNALENFAHYANIVKTHDTVSD